jgi:hypothetical protein
VVGSKRCQARGQRIAASSPAQDPKQHSACRGAIRSAARESLLCTTPQSNPHCVATELQGIHREVLLRALKVLEAQGKVRWVL